MKKLQAKKSLGQNFLINDNIIDNIVSLLNVSADDLVIEIGPGMGALTKRLVNFPSKLLCIEIDTDMIKYLSKYESERCTIIYDDILNIDVKALLQSYHYKNIYVIGNLPYYITSPIISKLIESNINIKEMIFMVQKEVAERFTASYGHKEYGYMTIYLNFHYKVSLMFDVLKHNFNPMPKVDSSIIKFTKINRDITIDENKYFNFLKDAFRYKRKTLKNNLSNYDFNKINKILKKYNLSEKVRPEEISNSIFIEIFKNIF